MPTTVDAFEVGELGNGSSFVEADGSLWMFGHGTSFVAKIDLDTLTSFVLNGGAATGVVGLSPVYCPSNSSIYLARGNTDAPNNVGKINVTTNAVSFVPVQTSVQSRFAALVGSKIFFFSYSPSTTLLILDTTTDTYTSTTHSASSTIYRSIVGPHTGRGYFFTSSASPLYWVEPGSNTLNSLSVPGSGTFLTSFYAPNGFIYIVKTGAIVTLDSATNTLTTVDTGTQTGAYYDDSIGLVLTRSGNTVAIFDTASNTVINSVVAGVTLSSFTVLKLLANGHLALKDISDPAIDTPYVFVDSVTGDDYTILDPNHVPNLAHHPFFKVSDKRIFAAPVLNETLGTVIDGSVVSPFPPVAAFSADVTTGFIPLTVTFDASSSTGSGLTYAWDFGDGSFGTGVNPSHTYTTVDDWVVTLTVTDEWDQTSTATETISTFLTPAPPELPPFFLTWWEPGSKVYERGVDRGVLYLKDGRVVPWSGLTSVDESAGRSTESVYFDGVKLSETLSLEGFSAKVSAITYPEQLEETYGNLKLRNGVYLGEQAQKSFGFCYRSKLGTELNEDAGYKLHIIYNITALPDDVSYVTISDEPNLTEFSWEFRTTPETITGYRPSAYLVLNSIDTTPELLSNIESILYGTEGTSPRLPPLSELLDIINGFNNFINITDNGDGTWTASTAAEGIINNLGGGVYEIQEANIQWTSTDSYLISPTSDPPPPLGG